MKHIFLTGIVFVIVFSITAACSPMVIQTAAPVPGLHEDEPQIANPASEYCLQKGGELTIEKRGDGGEFGVCVFEENRQCEEWALMRGDCPVGGIKVTGYLTPAGRYCAITGGEYAVTTSSGAAQEGGTCTFNNGVVCDVWEYFDGQCDPESPGNSSAYPQADETGQIVFSSNRGGDYNDLYLIDLEGEHLARLTEGDSTKFAGPFSPDGGQIIYTSFGLTTSDIYVMDADGGGQTDLTAKSDSDEGFPDWSPDGSRIAFSSRRDGNNEIYIMGANGSDPKRLTDNPTDDFAPSWSPDGTQIVFVSDRDQEPGIYDLYIMEADGSLVTRLTDDESIDYSPDWSPDGTRIVFRSHHDGPADIYTISVDRGDIENLTDTPDDEWAPTWSPDGTQIAFQTNRDGNWEIYTMNADGSGQTNLTNNPADDQLPFWRPAGTQEAPESQAETPPEGEKIPLEQAVESLKPKDVWENFYNLTQVPRPSHHEEKVRDFLVEFGKDLDLETVVDQSGNVIIRKPATEGMQDYKGVVLQGHMDMVPNKTADKDFDFLNDPIEAYLQGGWITADRTTLGADDGIGLAIIMAVLQSQNIEHGPLEGLFTVNEEDGFDGAFGLKPGVLQGSILLNLDWETEGSFAFSSAGGEVGTISSTYQEEDAPQNMQAYRLDVQGLKGGHSGVDINLGRGHAIKLLVRFLSYAIQNFDIRIAEISGGAANNAIPHEASALVLVPGNKLVDFKSSVQDYENIFQQEMAVVEPDLSFKAETANLPGKVMGETFQKQLVNLIYSTPQGVMRMSDDVPGLVETSTNMGIVQVKDGELRVTFYPRSSVDTALDDIAGMISSVWSLGGYQVNFNGRYPGWKPDPDSPILALMKEVYLDLYGKEAEVVAVHAGLECGVIHAKYPEMGILSFGPTLVDVHTPDERLEAASVPKVMDLLVETLKRIPKK